MSRFTDAMDNSTLTTNGMPTLKSSMSGLVDLFFKMGGARNANIKELELWFSKAYEEDQDLALRAMFYNRDIRGGQGERRSFRIFFNWLCKNKPSTAIKVLPYVPEYGRWDDLFVAFGTSVENNMIGYIVSQLDAGKNLLYKWLPREGKKYNALAKKFMKALDLSPKQYRLLLSKNTQVVESLMCSKKWAKIKYEQVPSIASNKYRKAFYKNDSTRYAQWVEDVKKGKSKVNASAIFPHDIMKKVFELPYYSASRVEINSIEAQWGSLPNYIPEGKSFIPVCDVSGSMGMGNGLPMLVSVSLGMYLAERNTGPFKNGFFTFSERPEFQVLRGSNIVERARSLRTAAWGMNTNIEAVFSKILSMATASNLSPEDMPSNILILSDMQFDRASGSHRYSSAFQMIKRKYKEAGYTMPGIIFWNLNTSNGVPVAFDQEGTALVSGFSPSIMKTVLSGELSPVDVMLRTLRQERYNIVY